MQKTIGGDRLGSGKRMKVDLKGYERSSHNMGYIFRSTMSAGTLVPFLVEVALPGDTFDIDLECDMKSHPTVGPLFGSYKVQLDVFQAPMRLYQGQLHNNKLGIGMNMAAVKLPVIELTAAEIPVVTIDGSTPDNTQINPSCILSYLGIRGVGNPLAETAPTREFNAIPLLAYWDIFKNYYANKQEENAYVIHQDIAVIEKTVDLIEINGTTLPEIATGAWFSIPKNAEIVINFTGTQPNLQDITIQTMQLGPIVLGDVIENVTVVGTTITGYWGLFRGTGSDIRAYNWTYVDSSSAPLTTPKLVAFPLEDIDRMRELIMAAVQTPTAFEVTTESVGQDVQPYRMLLVFVLLP